MKGKEKGQEQRKNRARKNRGRKSGEVKNYTGIVLCDVMYIVTRVSFHAEKIFLSLKKNHEA
jgi:hypothetical protein